MWPGWREAEHAPPARFAADGVAALGPVLDEPALASARVGFDRLITGGVVGPYATIVHDAWRRSPELAALVPLVGAAAAAGIGVPALVLFHDHLLSKPAGGADMDWHQDFSYLPLDRADGVTLWVALDDITEANGCIYYRLGSHLLGERRAAWGIFADDDPRASLPTLDVPDGADVPGPTAAGCAIAHHTLTWHRSPTNTSPRARRAWALSFVTPDARWAPTHAPHPRAMFGERRAGDPLEVDLPRVLAPALSAPKAGTGGGPQARHLSSGG